MFDESGLNCYRHQGERMRFVIIKTSISAVCVCNLCSGCQGQSFFDQICSFTLFLGYTFGRPEWVSCQDNNSRFREDELTLIQLEIASPVEFHQLFWDKGSVLVVLYMMFIVFKSWLQQMEMIKNEKEEVIPIPIPRTFSWAQRWSYEMSHFPWQCQYLSPTNCIANAFVRLMWKGETLKRCSYGKDQTGSINIYPPMWSHACYMKPQV